MLKRFRLVVPALLALSLIAANALGAGPQYESAYMRVELAAHVPNFTALAVDSLGQKKLSKNPLRPPAANGKEYTITRVGRKIEYRVAGAPASEPAAWTFEFSQKTIHLTSNYSAQNPPAPMLLDINVNITRATLLGLMNKDGSVRLPALLHWPDQGTFRITSPEEKGLSLGYSGRRYLTFDSQINTGGDITKDYVKVTFPAATAARPRLNYTLDVVDIYPHVPGIAGDRRFDGFRRNWLNIFQLSPRHQSLANNATSDVCAFTLYESSAVAAKTPPLAPGLTALDLIRQSLDRYLKGGRGYGMAGPNFRTNPFPSLDAYPSLLIAAADYVHGSEDAAWLKKNYPGLKGWAAKMLAEDSPASGLLVDPVSGNSGSWDPPRYPGHAVNWWDCIGFGHEDAYSNALGYHALLGMAEMAKRAGHPEDAELYTYRAKKLRSAYYKTFYNPKTGVLAGWKSADGKLHDYDFTFVNGAAITYGLIPRDKANAIMDHLLAKMKKVGYTHFEYGLPGNLIPIRRDDYHARNNKRWGAPEKADGSDGYQIYENGGATAAMSYFTLQALYRLGRRKEADAILFPMLRSFEAGGFQGRGANGMTYDWKAWDGTPHGYEGFLADSYMALLAVLSR